MAVRNLKYKQEEPVTISIGDWFDLRLPPRAAQKLLADIAKVYRDTDDTDNKATWRDHG